jgi:Cell division protein FtsI/penicillin-binding protein 2
MYRSVPTVHVIPRVLRWGGMVIIDVLGEGDGVKRRVYVILVGFSVLFLIIAFRVLYLQVFQSESLSKAASEQRVISSSIERPRGMILDRNGITFTSRTVKYTAVLKPLYLADDDAQLREISDILWLDYDDLKEKMKNKNLPVLVDVDENKKNSLLALKLEGVSVVYSLNRYDSNTLARHVLGYLAKKDQVGQAGIEKAFEDILKENGKNSVGVIADAGKNLVKGLGYRINKNSGNEDVLDVKLTLDYHIQKIVEDVLLKNNITGAVVVENVNTGEIAAMASKPDFKQDSIEEYLQSPGNELFNRAVGSYNIGSVFKIIDVAAMLENNEYVGGDYFCAGSVKAGGNIFKCSKTEGHGEVDLTGAFAYSCNSYFITKSMDVGYKKLVTMAKLFGLGNYVGINEQGVNEAKGNLPDADAYYSAGDIANLSIGQGVIMATPVQVADIVATVANGGIKNKVNLVDSIVDKDGKKIKEVKVKEGHRIISKETANKIKVLMEAVTDYGTGTAAKLELYGGGAGKTGSAQTGSRDVVHAWFAGYFPREQPKYSIAVLVENGQYGGKVAAPIFAEIAEEIMKKGL